MHYDKPLNEDTSRAILALVERPDAASIPGQLQKELETKKIDLLSQEEYPQMYVQAMHLVAHYFKTQGIMNSCTSMHPLIYECAEVRAYGGLHVTRRHIYVTTTSEAKDGFALNMAGSGMAH